MYYSTPGIEPPPIRILTKMQLIEPVKVISDTRLGVKFHSPGPYAGYEVGASLDFSGITGTHDALTWLRLRIGEYFTLREHDDSHTRGRYHRELVITHEESGDQLSTGGGDPR